MGADKTRFWCIRIEVGQEIRMKHFMDMPRIVWIWVILCGLAHGQRPASVNIGAVFTFDSVIGRAATLAMKMAVDDVNADPLVLNGTKLNLIMEDASCNVFLGSIGGIVYIVTHPCSKFQKNKRVQL